jgi:hypothetical protein
MAKPLTKDVVELAQQAPETVVKQWVGCYQTLPTTAEGKQPIQLLGKLTEVSTPTGLNQKTRFQAEETYLTQLSKQNITGFVGFTTTANDLTVPLATNPFGEVFVRCFNTKTDAQPSGQIIAKTIPEYLQFQRECYNNNRTGYTTTANREVNIDPNRYFKPLPIPQSTP